MLCRAERGAAGMRELMELTPCDVFPYLRGRTIWLVGDSMMQVRCTVSALSLPCQALHQTCMHAYTASAGAVHTLGIVIAMPGTASDFCASVHSRTIWLLNHSRMLMC